MPVLTPSSIASTVTSRVPISRPLTTGSANMESSTNGQLKDSLVSSMLTNIATSTAMAATASHRPGWRTGTASMRPGRCPSAAGSVTG